MQDSPATKGWMRRGFLGIPLVVWLVVSTTTAALAVIGISVLLGMNGTVTTGEGIDVTYAANATLTTSTNSSGTCTASATSTEISLTVLDMDPDEHCYIEVEVINDGPADAKLQSFDTSVNDNGSGSTGISSTVRNTVTGDYCGVLIPSDGTPVTVGFQIDFRWDLVPDQTYTLSPGNDGLRFARSNLYVDGNCQ